MLFVLFSIVNRNILDLPLHCRYRKPADSIGRSQMQANITADLVKKLKPKEKPYEIWDTELKGFILRVQPSGVKTFIAEYARHKRIPIGQATPQFSAAAARIEAGKKIADYVKGNDPMEAKRAGRAHTLESFLRDHYQAWAEANLRHSGEAMRKLASWYPAFGNTRLADITPWNVEISESGALQSRAVGIHQTESDIQGETIEDRYQSTDPLFDARRGQASPRNAGSKGGKAPGQPGQIQPVAARTRI
jgi:hypothetical protein